jgi:hypothetical protein
MRTDDEALPPCTLCAAPTRREPNPFYGTALSVHRDVLVCTACGTVGFAPAAADAPEEARVRSHRVGLRARVAGWYRALP